MGPAFRAEGPVREINVGGTSCPGHSFPGYFIPGKGPTPPGSEMLVPLGLLSTCPVSLQKPSWRAGCRPLPLPAGPPGWQRSLCLGPKQNTL